MLYKSSADEKLGFVFVCLFRVVRVSIHTAKCPFIVQTNNEYLLKKISWYINDNLSSTKHSVALKSAVCSPYLLPLVEFICQLSFCAEI